MTVDIHTLKVGDVLVKEGIEWTVTGWPDLGGVSNQWYVPIQRQGTEYSLNLYADSTHSFARKLEQPKSVSFQIGDVVERIRNDYGSSSGKYVKGYITDYDPSRSEWVLVVTESICDPQTTYDGSYKVGNSLHRNLVDDKWGTWQVVSSETPTPADIFQPGNVIERYWKDGRESQIYHKIRVTRKDGSDAVWGEVLDCTTGLPTRPGESTSFYKEGFGTWKLVEQGPKIVLDTTPKIDLTLKVQKVELRVPKAGEAYLFGSDYQVASADMTVERWVVTL